MPTQPGAQIRPRVPSVTKYRVGDRVALGLRLNLQAVKFECQVELEARRETTILPGEDIEAVNAGLIQSLFEALREQMEAVAVNCGKVEWQNKVRGLLTK